MSVAPTAPEALRGPLSLLAGLTFPLGGWWYGRLSRLRGAARWDRGYVLILPGVEGKGPLNRALACGLADGGLPYAIDVCDWTTGAWPLFAYHLRHQARADRKARRLARRLTAYQDAYPGRPTFLVGHSGGAALAVRALECLPPGRRVTAAVLLGPALSRGYDLSRALARTKAGIWNCYSPFDLLFLTAGTLLFGTLDGRHGVSAGAWGFAGRWPGLQQVRYQPGMARAWHFGGHFGWANRAFAARWLAGLLRTCDRR